ncbi:MAG: hypothetical protein ACYS22_06510, partial [Planctomycetota bacterium]
MTTRTKHRTGLLALAATLLLTGSALAQDTAPRTASLDTLLPQQTLGYVELASYADMKAAFAGERGQFWREFDPFFEYLMKGMNPYIDEMKGEFANETGFSLDAVLAVAKGGIQVGFIGIDEERGAPRMVGALNIAGARDEATQILGRLAGEPGEGPEPERHQGFVIKQLRDPPLAYTIAGDSIYFSIMPDDLNAVLDRLKGGAAAGSSAAPLTRQPNYVATMGSALGDDFGLAKLYVNLEGVLAMAQGEMSEGDLAIAKELGLFDLKGAA